MSPLLSTSSGSSFVPAACLRARFACNKDFKSFIDNFTTFIVPRAPLCCLTNDEGTLALQEGTYRCSAQRQMAQPGKISAFESLRDWVLGAGQRSEAWKEARIHLHAGPWNPLNSTFNFLQLSPPVDSLTAILWHTFTRCSQWNVPLWRAKKESRHSRGSRLFRDLSLDL